MYEVEVNGMGAYGVRRKPHFRNDVHHSQNTKTIKQTEGPTNLHGQKQRSSEQR